MCAAGSSSDTSEPMPGPRQGQGASAMLIMGNASLATLRVGEPAEEHQGWPPSPSAAMVPAQHPAEPRGRVAIVRPEPSAPPAQDREGLTRALQRELRRLGCYAGKVDAVWNVSTRVAMKAFTDQVNARLPNDQPDHILLALARSHQDRTCVQRCREASGLTRPGQCPSSATLTQVAGDSVTAAAVAYDLHHRGARGASRRWGHARLLLATVGPCNGLRAIASDGVSISRALYSRASKPTSRRRAWCRPCPPKLKPHPSRATGGANARVSRLVFPFQRLLPVSWSGLSRPSTQQPAEH